MTPIAQPIASALALAWARTIPPQHGDAWRHVDAQRIGLAAWQHVPALVAYVAELEAQRDAARAELDAYMRADAVCARCAREGAA